MMKLLLLLPVVRAALVSGAHARARLSWPEPTGSASLAALAMCSPEAEPSTRFGWPFAESGSVSAGSERTIPVLGRVNRRLRRGRDASTLLDLSIAIDDASKAQLYLNKEVSLSGVAADVWSELGNQLSQKARATTLDKVMAECSAGFAELGRAAQASLVSTDADTKQKSLASAGERARNAIREMERIAEGYAYAAGEAGEFGVQRFNEAGRRDAIRAIGALERAPGALQREVRRQRLKRLKRELRVLGLERYRLDKITPQAVRMARATRAKALHPDLRQGAAARAIRDGGSAGDGLFGFLGRLFGGGGAPAAEEEVDDGEAMRELNEAYDAVFKAVSLPIYDLSA
jgi:hypothetical protein